MPTADDLARLLDLLAQKLTGPAETLFNIYIHRVILESLIQVLIFTALYTIVTIVSIWAYRTAAKQDAKNVAEGESDPWERSIGIVLWLIASVVFVIFITAPLTNLLSPDYGALRLIITQATGK